ncbi:hypothetical protein HK096_000581 [Nowakowskiella sp. JEL0078]|nr:hypothetical protein HK096_000581 [Nowakowskiella sp. JEL0078]
MILASASHKNDGNNDRQFIGNKADLVVLSNTRVFSTIEEFLLCEVVGPPSMKDEKKYKRDRMKLFKNMKLCVNEQLKSAIRGGRKHVRSFGLLIYGMGTDLNVLIIGFNFEIFTMNLPFQKCYLLTRVANSKMPTNIRELSNLPILIVNINKLYMKVGTQPGLIRPAAYNDWERRIDSVDSDDGEENYIHKTLTTPRKKEIIKSSINE